MKKTEAEFLCAMIEEFDNSYITQEACIRLLSLAKSHQRIEVMRCNVGDTDYLMKRQRALRSSMTKVGNTINATLKFGGDPRGFTVKVMMPKTKLYNSWGGAEEGYGVPT